jgi:hypothetical protein
VSEAHDSSSSVLVGASVRVPKGKKAAKQNAGNMKKIEPAVHPNVEPDKVLEEGISGAACNISAIISADLLNQMASFRLENLKSISLATTPNGTGAPSFSDNDILNDSIESFNVREDPHSREWSRDVSIRGDDGVSAEWLESADIVADDDSDVYNAYRELLGMNQVKPIVQPAHLIAEKIAIKPKNPKKDVLMDGNEQSKAHGRTGITERLENSDVSVHDMHVSVNVKKPMTNQGRISETSGSPQSEVRSNTPGTDERITREEAEESVNLATSMELDDADMEAKMEAELRALLRAGRAERDAIVVASPLVGHSKSSRPAGEELSMADSTDASEDEARLPPLKKHVIAGSLSTSQLGTSVIPRSRFSSGAKSTDALPTLPNMPSNQIRTNGVRKLGALAAIGATHHAMLDKVSTFGEPEVGCIPGSLNLLEVKSLFPVPSSRIVAPEATHTTAPTLSGSMDHALQQLKPSGSAASDRSINLSHDGSTVISAPRRVGRASKQSQAV